MLTGIELHAPERAYELTFYRTGKQFLVDSSKRIIWADRFIASRSRLKVHLIHLIRDSRGWYASERRWREADVLAIDEDPRVAALLKLYDRVVTPDSLQLTGV